MRVRLPQCDSPTLRQPYKASQYPIVWDVETRFIASLQRAAIVVFLSAQKSRPDRTVRLRVFRGWAVG
jgi:hypothetical protein